MDNPDDFPTLEQDARLAEPLRRVAYEAGMMLGLEATRDEQAYHRRRLTRQQYWLQGYGTLAGMAVSMRVSPQSASTVRLEVGPGLGIDGLGREVVVHETYCINLGEWLAAQSESHLREGYDQAGGFLWLKATVRQKDCAVAMQPVLARKLNLSTDAVQPSRTAESVQLELIPELPDPPDSGFKPWGARFKPWGSHKALAEAMPALTIVEQDTLDDLEAADAAAAAQLSLHARLLHALDGGMSPSDLADDLAAGARLLLARIRIEAADFNAIVIDPKFITINNLVRPFLASASQLAWLARQP